jgi:hypothetical protein
MWLDNIQSSALEVPRKSNRTKDKLSQCAYLNRQTRLELTSSGLTMPPISSRPDKIKSCNIKCPGLNYGQTFEMHTRAHAHGVKVYLPSNFLTYTLTKCNHSELTPLPR